MSDFDKRKFIPSKKHFIAVLFILISVILFISGFYRADRISGRHTMMGLTFSPEVYKGDSILFCSRPLETKLKGSKNETALVKKTLSGNIIEEYDVFIDYVAEYYRPVMVKKGTDEYDKYINGEEVSGYFTEEYFDSFPELMSDMGRYYEFENKITDNNYSQLGIVIVDRKKELLSFMWGIPFLVIGLILFKIAGSLFIHEPDKAE